ncbi:MAG: hypothetical protein M3Q27_10725, partial [Actinomycetota bacterium]|nr:hypothetical protein [Actinomycetota bacterium]
GRPPVTVDQVATDVSRAGGCAVGYGRGAACLPALPPEHPGHSAGTPRIWTCSQVRDLLPQGIAVNRPQDGTAPAGVDPLGLDSDGDLVACDTGDA